MGHGGQSQAAGEMPGGLQVAQILERDRLGQCRQGVTDSLEQVGQAGALAILYFREVINLRQAHRRQCGKCEPLLGGSVDPGVGRGR